MWFTYLQTITHLMTVINGAPLFSEIPRKLERRKPPQSWTNKALISVRLLYKILLEVILNSRPGAANLFYKYSFIDSELNTLPLPPTSKLGS